MSGYRTLHRIQPGGSSPPSSSSSAPPPPLWRVRFSPCPPPPSSPPPASSSGGGGATAPPRRDERGGEGSLRLLTAGAPDFVQCHVLSDRTGKDADTDAVLDASALKVERAERLVSGERYDSLVDGDGGGGDGDSPSPSPGGGLGYAALDVVRNRCGEDRAAGDEVVVASQLGGRVCAWVRLDPALAAKGAIPAEGHAAPSEVANENGEAARYVGPHAEFEVKSATGTTLAIRPPNLAHGHPKRDSDLLVALGCADGSVVLCKTGILAARPGDRRGAAGGVVGDSSSQGDERVEILSGSTPGEVVATVGGGHACVLSLAFHPSIPNAFVVGRKDGTIDIYASKRAGDPDFRRTHRLSQPSTPVRAVGLSRPDGALLFAGDDAGTLYSYDASCNDETSNVSSPVKLAGCARSAHRGWIVNLVPFPDGKRVATCGSDRTARVWECGTLGSGTASHSFEGAHGGIAWGIDCAAGGGGGGGGGASGRAGGGDRTKLVSCGNDGAVQVYSCGE
ncbi:hypothetical protein ACHAWF_012889 [Thalassiosira exigua]